MSLEQVIPLDKLARRTEQAHSLFKIMQANSLIQSMKNTAQLVSGKMAAYAAIQGSKAKRSCEENAEGEVSNPDENIIIDSPTTNNYHQQAPSQLGKILLGAGLMATGIGVPIGAAIIASGVKDTVVPPVTLPAEKPVETTPERPTVNIGEYELRLGK